MTAKIKSMYLERQQNVRLEGFFITTFPIHTLTYLGPHSKVSLPFVCWSSEFLLSGLSSWAQCSVKQLFHVFNGHNFRYWNTKMLNIASPNANSPHLGKKKDFILLFTDYKWQRSHHFHILQNPLVSVFLTLQIWDPKILPDIKVFSLCDIFIYFTTLFYSWNFHCCWITRLIMYVHSSHHSVIFYLLIHQNLLKNFSIYLYFWVWRHVNNWFYVCFQQKSQIKNTLPNRKRVRIFCDSCGKMTDILENTCLSIA